MNECQTRCIFADHENLPHPHPDDGTCCLHTENPWERDLRVAYNRIQQLEAALKLALENEVGSGHPCSGHFEGCRVQWGRQCDCGIAEIKATLGQALRGKVLKNENH